VTKITILMAPFNEFRYGVKVTSIDLYWSNFFQIPKAILETFFRNDCAQCTSPIL